VSNGDGLSVYEILGSERLTAMVAGFYRRVPDDPILAALYPEDDLSAAEQRLCDFLLYRLGGPDDYLHKRGHPRLRMRHAPFAVDRSARDRWMALMTESMVEQQLPDELRDYLAGLLGGIATFLVNRP